MSNRQNKLLILLSATAILTLLAGTGIFNFKIIQIVYATSNPTALDQTLITDCPTGQPCLTNPLGEGATPQILIGRMINAVLGLVGSLALVMFIYGGFTWMLSAGNQEKVQKGKNILIWASLGLIIIFTAYALVKFVFSSIGIT